MFWRFSADRPIRYASFVITVYGATGYSGALVAAALLERGATIRLAGRSEDKLKAMRARLGVDVPIAAVALDDGPGLRRLAESSEAIMHCAGPFQRFGPPMVRACLDGGAHYLDLTGELGFMRWVFDHDAEAKAKGVALVSAVGFDVVPSDFAAARAAAALTEASGHGDAVMPERVEIAMAVRDAKASRGTLRSQIGILGAQNFCYHRGHFEAHPLGSPRRRWVGPEGRAFWAVGAPLGDVATAPRTTGARDVCAYLVANAGLRTALGVANAAAPVARRFQSRLERWAERLLPPGAGPSDAERARTAFTYWAEARFGPEARGVEVSGRDPYGLTAVTAAEASLAAVGGGHAGVTTPTQLLGVARTGRILEDLGVRIRTYVPASEAVA